MAAKRKKVIIPMDRGKKKSPMKKKGGRKR
jgi:hypothetical protein